MNNLQSIDKKTFFQAIFEDYLKYHTGYIELRGIPSGKGPIERFFSDNVDEIVQCTTKENLYFGVCPRDSKSGKKENIKHVVTLWVDLDYDKEKAMKKLNEFEFSPSIINNSGYGLHAYWLLREPEEANEETEQILKGLANALDGDKVYDLPRILRVPNTLNVKDPANPKEVKIIKFNPELRYSLIDFEHFKAPIHGKVKDDIVFTGDIHDVDIYAMAINSETCEAIEKTLSKGNRSEFDFKIMCSLVRQGCNNDEIRGIFSKYPCGEKYREQGEAYFTHSLSKARAEVTKLEKTETLEVSFNKPTPLSEFVNKDIPPVEYLISDVLQKKGRTMISASTNVGKSFFLQNLALAVSRGEETFLDRFDVKKGIVLYLDMEIGESALKERLKHMAGDQVPENLLVNYTCGFDLLDDKHQKELEQWLSDNSVELLIIDAIGDAWAGDENDKQAVKGVTSYLDKIKDQYNCAILIAHHWRKSTQHMKSGGEMASGSYKWGAWLDHHVTLKGNINSVTVSCAKSRNGVRFSPFMVKLNEETLFFEYLADFEKKYDENTLISIFESFGMNSVPIIDMVLKAKKDGICSEGTLRKLIKESKQFKTDTTKKPHILTKRHEQDKEKDQELEYESLF